MVIAASIQNCIALVYHTSYNTVKTTPSVSHCLGCVQFLQNLKILQDSLSHWTYV